MSDPHTPSDQRSGPPASGRLLVVALIAFVVLVFAAASLGWTGLAIIAVVLAGAYAVLLRWSR